MTARSIEALHDIHTATNDVLKGYREMSARAEPEIQAVISQLTGMHTRHASEQQSELARFRDSGEDDESMQGTMNKVVVVVRDWISDLDRDALPAVRMGEESLLEKYNEAIEDPQLQDHPPVVALLKKQAEDISNEIARLPEA